MGKTGTKPTVYIHADDYGMTPETCRRILRCYDEGCLNYVGIVPNGCMAEAAGLLNERPDLPRSIHLNLVEGPALSSPGRESLLTGKNGHMKHSFGGLFLLSLSPLRKRLADEAYEEIRCQLLRVMEDVPLENGLCIDSHQHIHMIPLLFRTLIRVIDDCGLTVKQIRIPAEPLSPFLKEPVLYKTYSPVNVIKNIVLNILWLLDRRSFRRLGIKRTLFCGLIFSGKMDERVRRVYPHFYHLAEKKGWDLELVFHPGYQKPGEPEFDPCKTSFSSFYHSPGRVIENRFLREERNRELFLRP